MARTTAKPLPAEGVTVKVRYSGGAYSTQTVRGQRASSTSSAERAAQALACKLWPSDPAGAKELPAKGLQPGVSMWRLRAAGDGSHA